MDLSVNSKTAVDITIVKTEVETISDYSMENNFHEEFVCCDEIRRKINLYIATFKTTPTKFIETIGGSVTRKSFDEFMRLNGTYSGYNNETYKRAQRFFGGREVKVSVNNDHMDEKYSKETLKIALKKIKTEKGQSDDDDDKMKLKTIANIPLKKTLLPNMIMLPIKLPADFSIFEDCDEVRSNIHKYISTKGIMKASFAKLIGMSAQSLYHFLAQEGFDQGADSRVYVKAYRFFEEQRLQLGERKSRHRRKIEKLCPKGYSFTK